VAKFGPADYGQVANLLQDTAGMDLLVGAFCFLLQRFSVKPSLRLEDLPSFNRGYNLRRRFSQCNR
jgi:hypothetical protein